MIENKKLVNYILFCIGAVILVLFLITIDFAEIKRSMDYLNFRIILVLIALVMITIIIRGYRWKALIRFLTKKSISMNLAMCSVVAGVAAGILTPGRGIEIAKPLILKGTHGIKLSKSISAMIIEKVFDMLGYIFVFFLSLLFLPNGIHDKSMILAVGVIFIIIFLAFAFPGEISKILDFFLNKVYLPKFLKNRLIKMNKVLFISFSEINKRRILWLGAVSIGEVFLEAFVFYFILVMLNIEVNLFVALFAVTGAVLFSLLTMIPGGIGVNEVSQAEILRNVEPALAGNIGMIRVGILIHAVIGYYLLIAAGAVILIFLRNPKKKK